MYLYQGTSEQFIAGDADVAPARILGGHRLDDRQGFLQPIHPLADRRESLPDTVRTVDTTATAWLR
jgi:hypothetical protein